MKPKRLYHSKYGWLTVKEQRYSPVGNRIVQIAIDSKGIERELDGTEISEEEYNAEQERLQREKESTKKNQSFDENLREVFSHMKLVKGAKGDPGKDGYTPKAGVDYYTKKQIEVLIESIQDKTLKGTIQSLIEDIRPIKGKDYFDGKDGYTPQYGKDYFTKEDIQMFFSEITKKVQSKVRNGIDGKDGKKGKGVEFKWEGTKLYIKKEGEEWGEGKDLKGLDGLNGGGGGIHKIEDATDVSTKNVVIGNALVWNGSQWVPGEAGAVESVNGQTGVVVLDYEDVGAEPTKGEDDNYVTDAEKIVIGNTSGANTGDETQTTIKTKLGPATASADGYATATQITKLDGIEALADVTDATNVAGAGAVMDGDFSSNGLMERIGSGTYGVKTIVTESSTIAGNDNDTSVPTSAAVKDYVDDNAGGSGAVNILSNGNFINNSTNGYGGTSDDWTNSSANPVQGGIPSLTKQNLIDWLGVSDGDIEGLWNLNEASGNAIDLSSNGYTLTDNNTVGSSDDGLMAKARDFEAGNSEYFSIASATNLNITGSQTFILFYKPESLVNTALMDTGQSGTEKRVFMLASGVVFFSLAGLTTNTSVTSDVTLGVGKWYCIIGKYDSVSQEISITINKIKKSATASGTTTSVANGLRIGKSDGATNYADGLIQNAGVLSVALTDAQVERLWWETLGKKTKLRRATSDGYIYQSLPQNLVEQYKGKTLSVTAKVYQDTASIAQVSLYDGAETASSTSATTGSWIDIGATRTISATARQIDVRAKVSSSDGNAWFKEIQVYEGSSLVYEWSPENPAKNEIGGVKSTINISPIFAPEGFLINGKIVPSVTSNNLTVAIKTLSGGDPSVSNPIYVRIGDTVRSITSALSVTKNAGTNWCNAGSDELATKEIDYFVYLGYNATDGVVIGFSRIPYGALYSDFSATTTNERYCAISTITNASAGDNYVNIGRFAATLSAGAGYTWSIPTFTTSNLKQAPIFETRWLTWQPVYSASGSMTYTSVSTEVARYKLASSECHLYFGANGTTGGTASNQIFISPPIGVVNNGSSGNPTFNASINDTSFTVGYVRFVGASNLQAMKIDSSNYGLGGSRVVRSSISYEI